MSEWKPTHTNTLTPSPSNGLMFVSNNYAEGRKVLSAIENELRKCDAFYISVAFITKNGVTPLLQTLKELSNHNIPGQILTTDYQTFSEPAALKMLNQFPNIEVKMFDTALAKIGFHTKGFIFKRDHDFHIIVGSSNLTQSALTTNREWNTRVISSTNQEYTADIIREFNQLWNDEASLPIQKIYDTYEAIYTQRKHDNRLFSQFLKATNQAKVSQKSFSVFRPNAMQISFRDNLTNLIQNHATRALLISATGTGKTYASAYALKSNGFNHVLFLVHREQIAKKSMDTYQHVYGLNHSFGLLSGNQTINMVQPPDFVFSTMQMMAKPSIHTQFKPNEFDAIVIDEAHRVGSGSYLRIMDYFKPKLWLGMTATPERGDNFDVYQQFDHNIAYEIRLQQALEEDMLCPFHYFGITDLMIDGQTIDDTSDFNHLAQDQRVDYIIQQIEFYGHCGDSVKGLVFTSRKDEAITLSHKFNKRGYRTIALTGQDSQYERERAIERLVKPSNAPDKLDYIFTVDIFNEGVDIPEINQVVMLRPTQSAIIFVQQLGRGLRKADDKDYVVVLDFIGNYTNNYLIPIALSGDRTYNKDNIRHYVLEGERIIPGCSTIHFDEISRKRIFKAIDAANFRSIDLIKENYKRLKFKLGKIPTLMDFDRYGEMDVLLIFNNQNLGSYYAFLEKYEKHDFKVRLNEIQAQMLKYVSVKLASGKRIHELLLLKDMMVEPNQFESLWLNQMKDYGYTMNEPVRTTVFNMLTNQFLQEASRVSFKHCVFMDTDSSNHWQISSTFKHQLDNPDFYSMLMEVIEFGIHRFNRNYRNTYQNTSLVLNQKYTYEDVCRLLNFGCNVVAQNIGGYIYNEYSHTFPVFINYDKQDDISDTIKYEDRFLDPMHLLAISKNNRSLESKDVQNFLHAKDRGIDVHLFIRKNKDDKMGKEFYYFGTMHATGQTKEFTMDNTNSKAVEIYWELDNPIREDLYEYIVEN